MAQANPTEADNAMSERRLNVNGEVPPSRAFALFTLAIQALAFVALLYWQLTLTSSGSGFYGVPWRNPGIYHALAWFIQHPVGATLAAWAWAVVLALTLVAAALGAWSIDRSHGQFWAAKGRRLTYANFIVSAALLFLMGLAFVVDAFAGFVGGLA